MFWVEIEARLRIFATICQHVARTLLSQAREQNIDAYLANLIKPQPRQHLPTFARGISKKEYHQTFTASSAESSCCAPPTQAT
jgi:hypothetical protein